MHEMLIGEGFHDQEFGVSGGEMLGTPEPAEAGTRASVVHDQAAPVARHGGRPRPFHSLHPPLTMLLDCTATR